MDGPADIQEFALYVLNLNQFIRNAPRARRSFYNFYKNVR